MGSAVEVTRGEYSASDLRALAARTADGAVVRRILAIAMVLEGQPSRGRGQVIGSRNG